MGDGVDHALSGADLLGLGPRPVHEEDRVVDAQGHEEDERQQRHLEIERVLAEQHAAKECSGTDGR